MLRADIELLALRLAEAKFWPDLIVGITRGGCVPAVTLSHWTNIPCTMMDYSLRDHGMKEKRYDIIDGHIGEDDKTVLIVDDINDTGDTFTDIYKEWSYHKPQLISENVRTFTLIEKSHSKFRVDFCNRRDYNNGWVVFPWEQKPTTK